MEKEYNELEEELWMVDLLQRNLQLSIEKGCTPEQIENCCIERDNWIESSLKLIHQDNAEGS